MQDAWNVLRDAGVPDGAARPMPKGPMDAAATAEALRSLFAGRAALDDTEQECLAAWLAAFRHHWPDRFAFLLGPIGEDAHARAVATVSDRNKYLKLRRIATANLSRLL